MNHAVRHLTLILAVTVAYPSVARSTESPAHAVSEPATSDTRPDLARISGKNLASAEVLSFKNGKLLIRTSYGEKKALAFGSYDFNEFTPEAQVFILKSLNLSREDFATQQTNTADDTPSRERHEEGQAAKLWEVKLKMRDYSTVASSKAAKYSSVCKQIQTQDRTVERPQGGSTIPELKKSAADIFDEILALKSEWFAYAKDNKRYLADDQRKQLIRFTGWCDEIIEAKRRYAEYLIELAKIQKEQRKERREEESLDLMRRQTRAMERQATAQEQMYNWQQWGW